MQAPYFQTRTWQRILLACAAFSAPLFVWGFFFNPVNGDEAMIAEHAYRLVEEGRVRSEMARAFGDFAIRQYLYHKLFVWLGSLAYRLAGLHYLAFRSISLLAVAGLLGLMWVYLRRHLQLRATVRFIALGLLLNAYYFFSFASIYRPEALVTLLGFSSFLCLELGREQDRWTWIAGAGLCAGLSALTHLNGLAFVAAGGLWLLFQKKWVWALLFGFFAGLGFAAYAVDLLAPGDWQAMVRQFRNDPNLDDSDFSLLGKFNELLGEQMRFFWNAPASVLSALFIPCVLVFWKTIRQGASGYLLRYFGCLFLSIGLLLHGKMPYYGLLYYPFIFSLIAVALETAFQHPAPVWKNRAVLTAACLFFLFNVATNLQYTRWESPNQISRELARLLPEKNVGVYVNDRYALPLLKDYAIHAPMSFEWQYREKGNGRMPTQAEFFAFMRRQKNTYVVLDKRYATRIQKHLFSGQEMPVGTVLFGYRVVVRNEQWTILKKDF